MPHDGVLHVLEALDGVDALPPVFADVAQRPPDVLDVVQGVMELAQAGAHPVQLRLDCGLGATPAGEQSEGRQEQIAPRLTCRKETFQYQGEVNTQRGENKIQQGVSLSTSNSFFSFNCCLKTDQQCFLKHRCENLTTLLSQPLSLKTPDTTVGTPQPHGCCFSGTERDSTYHLPASLGFLAGLIKVQNTVRTGSSALGGS